MGLIWLSRRDKNILHEVLTRYQEIEDEARMEVLDDPNVETTSQLYDLLKDYQVREDVIAKLIKKVQPPPPYEYDSYSEALHERIS